MERYEGQHTPWIPNHSVVGGVIMGLDTLGGASCVQAAGGDVRGWANSLTLMESAAIANFYCDLFSIRSLMEGDDEEV